MMAMNDFKISEDMPHFFLRVPYIRFGYLYHKNLDALMCVKSLFPLHNQTMNVFTHFLPALYFFK